MKWRCAKILVVIIVCVFATSCNYRKIVFDYYQYADILLRVDWTNFVEEEPTGMSVYCYSVDDPDQTPAIFLSNNIDSVKLSLPIGEYNILVFNQSVNEFGTMNFTGMSKFETAAVELETYTPKWTIGSGERIVCEPEWLGVDTIKGFRVTQKMIEATADYQHGLSKDPYSARIDASPRNVVRTVDVKVALVGINYARSVRGSVTGMAAGYYLGRGECIDEKGTNVLERWTICYTTEDKSKGYVGSQYRTFGLKEENDPERSQEDNKLNMSILLIDNKTVVDFAFPVGDWFVPANDVKTLQLWTGFISDDPQDPSMSCDPARPVRLPKVDPEHGGDAGFDTSIGDWDDPTEVRVEV